MRSGQCRGVVGNVRTSSKTRSKRANARAVQHGGARTRPAKARDRPHKAREREVALTEQDIVDCTLRLIRGDGLESLSMRKLASELDVAPMSLYHHVKNKDELLDRVVNALLARIPTPVPRRARWREQLRTYAMAFIEQLTAQGGIARIVVERPPTTESQRHLRYTGAVLLAAGFDTHAAAQCLATFHTFIYGVLAVRAHLPALMATVAKKYDAPLKTTRKASTPSEPSTSINEHLRNLGLQAWYQAGIDSILSAIALQLPSAPRRRAPAQLRGEA